MRTWKWIGLLFAGLCGPAAVAAVPPPASITYEAGACFGFCPVYRITVQADGRGIVDGDANVAAKGRHRIKASAAQVRAFAAELAPLRPRSGAIRYSPDSICGPSPTDGPSVRVTWRGPSGVQSLYFYHGCDRRRFGAIADRLLRAPKLLPVAGLIRTVLPSRRR